MDKNNWKIDKKKCFFLYFCTWHEMHWNWTKDWRLVGFMEASLPNPQGSDCWGTGWFSATRTRSRIRWFPVQSRWVILELNPVSLCLWERLGRLHPIFLQCPTKNEHEIQFAISTYRISARPNRTLTNNDCKFKRTSMFVMLRALFCPINRIWAKPEPRKSENDKKSISNCIRFQLPSSLWASSLLGSTRKLPWPKIGIKPANRPLRLYHPVARTWGHVKSNTKRIVSRLKRTSEMW